MEDKYFVIKLGEKITSNNSNEVDEYIQSELEKNKDKIPIFDADNLVYISSSGLRIFLRIQKKYTEKIRIINTSFDVYDIFDMTGFTQLLSIEKKMKSVSVDGCKIIGKGYNGIVYRLNDDIVVKVYKEKDSIPMIKNEQQKAKIAFVAGIPTAISYDIVKVGDLYGSMFELLKAKTLNEIIIENPNELDSLLVRYVDFIKSLHNTEVKEGILPQAKDNYFNYLNQIKNILPSNQFEKIYSLLKALPNDNHLSHGDIHLKNIMLVDNELTLIDMDTLATGQSVFDNCGIYLSYMQFKEDDPNNAQNFFGITSQLSEYIWNKFIDLYYNPQSEEEYNKIFAVLYVLSSVQFL